MSGLGPEQLDELEERVAALLENPWDSGADRPKELTLREAIIVSSGYARQNIIEDVWAEIFDTSQPTISRIITKITPLIEKATAEFRLAAGEARAASNARAALNLIILFVTLLPTACFPDRTARPPPATL